MTDILQEAKTALEIEKEGIANLIPRLGDSFKSAVEMIFSCKGKVAVTGMGKSGHIANKISATLASTGTMAFFLHPAEAIHGDLGMVSRNDIVLALSNSGQTEEVLRLLGPMRRMGVPLISLTGNPKSELARRSEVHLDVSVEREACPLGLAPTASTTAALAMGDTIAVCLLRLRNFKPEDYALFHPGGSLGKKLMTVVGDLMDRENLPQVAENDEITKVIAEMTAKTYGITAVVDGEGRLTGVFSLGDFSRLHIQDPTLSFYKKPVIEFMSVNPKTTNPDQLAARALHTMESMNIRALIVTDEEKHPVGIIGIYETLKAIDY